MQISFDIKQMLLVIPVLLLTFNNVDARQFRLMNPIATSGKSEQLPGGAIKVAQVKQLPRDKVEPLVREVMENWNSPSMSETLSDQFYDKSRLLDVMDTGVPRDAKLRVQSIQGIQTLNQYINQNDATGREEMVSIVSATVRTQLEYNNSSGGFVSQNGTNELILKIRSSVK